MTLISYLTRHKTSSLFFFPFKMACFSLSTRWHWYVFYVNVLFKICIPSGDVLILYRRVGGHSQRGNSASGAGRSSASLLFGDTFIRLVGCSLTWRIDARFAVSRSLSDSLCQPAGLLYFTRWARVCIVGQLRERVGRSGETPRSHCPHQENRTNLKLSLQVWIQTFITDWGGLALIWFTIHQTHTAK